MVHSVAAHNGVVFAAHNGKLFRDNDAGIDLDLRQIGLANDGSFLVGLVAESKDVVVLDAASLKERARHTFPKRPCAWTVSGEWLIVSDKFGDVFKAPLLTTNQHLDTNEEGFGSAILGHVSMVLGLASTEKEVFSSDRDGHIRISRLPHSYIIDQFLLGHSLHVSHLLLHKDFLLSCGGDPYAILWDWKSGSEVGRLELRGDDFDSEVGVISAVLAGGRVYLAVEDSNSIVSADFPSLENRAVIDTGSPVHSLAADDADVYIARANGVQKLNEELKTFEGESPYELVSEKHLRKKN